MRESKIKNAVITDTRIEIEDHGCLTAWLMLDYGGSSQGFGGYNLGVPGANYCGVFIRKCLEIVGVDNWKDLRGKTIRVKASEGSWGTIKGIGNIVKDQWFYPGEEFEKMEAKAKRKAA